MRSIFRTALLAAATFSFTAMAEFNATLNTDGQEPGPPTDLRLNTPIPLGCFSAPGEMSDMGIYTYQSPGWCQALCVRISKAYFANVNGTNCFCGDAPPANEYKADNSSCDVLCGGTHSNYCGGTNFWYVENANFHNGDPTGTQKITIPAPTWTWSGSAATSSTSSSTTVASTIVVTQQASTTPVVTPTSTPQATSSPNVAAIAAGVVVGIVLLVAIVGGIFFFMRRRKQQALVEEQRRHEMMTSFVTGEKPRSGYTSPDSRLDPSLMFQRRLSDGSIRDNEDYSRRILKVANPDD